MVQQSLSTSIMPSAAAETLLPRGTKAFCTFRGNQSRRHDDSIDLDPLHYYSRFRLYLRASPNDFSGQSDVASTVIVGERGTRMDLNPYGPSSPPCAISMLICQYCTLNAVMVVLHICLHFRDHRLVATSDNTTPVFRPNAH